MDALTKNQQRARQRATEDGRPYMVHTVFSRPLCTVTQALLFMLCTRYLLGYGSMHIVSRYLLIVITFFISFTSECKDVADESDCEENNV